MKRSSWLGLCIALQGCASGSPVPPINQQPYGLVLGVKDLPGNLTSKCPGDAVSSCRATAQTECAPNPVKEYGEELSGTDLLLGFSCQYPDPPSVKEPVTTTTPTPSQSAVEPKQVRITLTCPASGSTDACLDDASRACPTGFHDSRHHIGKREQTLTITCNPPAAPTTVVVSAPEPDKPTLEQTAAGCRVQVNTALPNNGGLVQTLNLLGPRNAMMRDCMTAAGYSEGTY